MTTAARPTFNTARGGEGQRERDLSALSKQYSSRDLPSHTSLKVRERGQGTQEELSQKDFRRELEERERAAASSSSKDHHKRSLASSDRKAIASDVGASSSKRSRSDPSSSGGGNIDADDPLDDSSDSDSDSDDDDDTALMMAELQKIRQEKAQEEREREEDRRAEEEQIRMENILTGNPLMKERYSASAAASAAPSGGDMRVKRRWDDDVVFKNCSRAEPEKKESQFINDSLRSTFHRKFMDKYIK